MAMTYTAIADKPVLVEEGTFAYNYKASGTIYAGCALCCSGGTELVKPLVKNPGLVQGHGYIGVAAYNATDGEQISAYGPGNKVRVRASGAITVGQSIRPVAKGFFKANTYTQSGQWGVALEAISDNSYGKVLLY